MSIGMERLFPKHNRYETAPNQVRGTRTMNRITFIPSTASPESVIQVEIPKLGPDMCIVPQTMCLVAEFKNKNTKSWYLNNLGKLLCGELEITFDAKRAYQNRGEGNYDTYADLWVPEERRVQKVRYGIQSENLRKLASGDDSASSSDAGDNAAYAANGSEIRICLGKILNDHGPYPSFGMKTSVRYNITLPKAEDIMVAQSGESVAGYTLENIRLEYETITNSEMYEISLESYDTPRSLDFKDVTMMEKRIWNKDSTLENIHVNIPRKYMSGIVLLFDEEGVAKTDSEKYVYPNLESIDITIEGSPGQVYNKGIQKGDFFREAKRFFQPCHLSNMSFEKFYSENKFAAVIDLRSLAEENVVKAGRHILNTQSGVLLEIKKKATTRNIGVKIYVISDARVDISGRMLSAIHNAN